jgi:hypothetical protein
MCMECFAARFRWIRCLLLLAVGDLQIHDTVLPRAAHTVRFGVLGVFRLLFTGQRSTSSARSASVLLQDGSKLEPTPPIVKDLHSRNARSLLQVRQRLLKLLTDLLQLCKQQRKS